MIGVPGWRVWRSIAWLALIAMLLPVLAGIAAAVPDSEAVDPETLGFRGGEVLLATIAWSTGLAAVAVVLALAVY